MNVVVTGPESSGTRLVARWLEQHPDLVARHWSMPSGERWMRHWPTEHDFEGEPADRVIFVMRNLEATIASQKGREMVTCRAEAEANITQAHLRTFTWAVSHGCPVYPLLYDEVIREPSLFDALFRWLGCEPLPPPEPITDENEKWLCES